MKFHFDRAWTDNGTVTLANHPSAFLTIDAHASRDGDVPQATTHDSQMTDFRTHLPRQGTLAAYPDTHYPRPRPFFRLGHHRGRDGTTRVDRALTICGGLTSDSSDDDSLRERRAAQLRLDSPAARGTRHFSLRRPRLRRYRSLPAQLAAADLAPSPANAPEAGLLSASAHENIRGIETVPSAEAGCAVEDCNSASPRRRVTFVSVEVREYSTILGDHPCCPTGLPLALGWDLERESSTDLESYEAARCQAGRRSKDMLRLGGETRRGILLESAAPSSPQGEGGVTSLQPRYTRRELERAERRLTRERAGINARLSLRQNRQFFLVTSARKCETGGDSTAWAGDQAVKTEKEEAEEKAIGSPVPMEEKKVTGMDIPPMKSQNSRLSS